MAEWEMPDEAIRALVNAVPDPLSLLDGIEIENTLPDASITINGIWDRGEGHGWRECAECEGRGGYMRHGEWLECPGCGGDEGWMV